MFRFNVPVFVISKFKKKDGEYENPYAVVMIGTEKKSRTCPVYSSVYDTLEEKTQYESVEILYRDGISKAGKPYTMLTIVG